MDPIGTAGLGGATTGRPLRVFLSHTHDLRRHPADGSFMAAAEAAVNRAGHALIDMQYFTARPGKPAAYCIDMVSRADIYVGILGLRYGTAVPDRPDLSYTELEFQAAVEKGLPRLIILVREDSPHLLPDDQTDDLRARQEAFRARVRETGVTVARAMDPNQLELKLYQALVELGSTPNAPGLLAEAQALLASMPVDVLPPRAPELPAGSRMPLAPNPLFVGRGDELLHLARALRGGDTTVALGQVVASTGLGGLGKTQLAVELIHRYGPFFAGGVFWLSFASAEEIPLQVAGCAAPGLEARPLDERVQRVRDAWHSALPRLLVFDNCEEETLFDAWRPSSGGCRVLVTSRRSEWTPTLGVTTLPLDLLPRADSIELLRRYRPDLAPNDPGLDAIAEEVGDLPLALHLAGSYLRAYRADITLGGYLAELRQESVVQHASLLGLGLKDVPNPTHHIQGVAQTFALCFGRLDPEHEVDRIAIALLARMACMAPGEPVPRDLLAKTMGDVDPRLWADGLRRLGAVGLVEEGEGWLRLHRLLAKFVRKEGLDTTAQHAVDRALIDCGDAADERRLSGQALAAVIPHMVAGANRETSDVLHSADLCNAAGLALRRGGALQSADPWLERALEIRTTTLGSDHIDTARSLNDLAGLRWEQGDLANALVLHRRALEIREMALGTDHLDTAMSINNVALLLWEQAELDEAILLHQRALAIRERHLAPEDPNLAESLNNLALVFRAKGELATAQSFYERALAGLEKANRSSHPGTATILYNLALVVRARGDTTAATPLFERALAIREHVLGPDHPTTALSLNGLVSVLVDTGEVTAARPLAERGLAIHERVHGPNHPHTALTLNSLGRLLRMEGDLDGAKALIERAVVIREQVLGPHHPSTAASFSELALVLQAQGDLVSARSHYERALGIWERALKPDHPDTAQVLYRLALLHRDQGDPSAARPLLERALAIRERVLGADHPDTVATRRALAELAADAADRPAEGG